jgi:hypothetical protein
MKSIINDEKKRSILILVIVVIILSIIIISSIFIKSKSEQVITTTTSTTTTSNSNVFKGYQVTNLEDATSYELDLMKNHTIYYANNEDDQVYTSVDDLDLIYEVKLLNGELVFIELRKDNSINGEVYTNKKYYLKLDKKISSFIIGHNCSDFEYSIVVLDEGNNVYRYDNLIDSNKSMKDIVNSFTKVNTISKVSKIGYYGYDSEPTLSCPMTEMLYLDKSNNIRLLDGKSTILTSNLYYKYIGNGDNGELIYVFNNKLMKYSNIDTYISNNNKNIIYRGSFYNEDNAYIISDDNYLYKVSLSSIFSDANINLVNSSIIKRIGTRVVSNDDYATDLKNVIIEFEDGEIVTVNSVYDYELLGY